MSRCALLVLALACAPVAAQEFDHTHADWEALLRRHVVLIAEGRASQLDYAGMARDRGALKAYLATLSRVSEPEFSRWSKLRQMAFLINAYNAFTVEKILTRYPDIASIWDFGRIFGNPFKDRFFRLLGGGASLDYVENERLRKPGAYDDPRIHFAINCASVGCPMLREEAYVADKLERQLEEQTRRFLSDRSRNRVSAEGRLEVSKVFDWFHADWTSGYRGIESRESFFAKYAHLLSDDPAHRRLVAEGRARIGFLEYDWALNDARKR